MVCFVNNYPWDSDLSCGWRYPTAFEQLGPELRNEFRIVMFETLNFSATLHVAP